MWTQPLVAVLVEVALTISAALLARRAKPIALVLSASAFLVVPWWAGSIPLLRGVAALLGGFGLLRVIDLVRVGDTWSVQRRVFHALGLVDSRTLNRAPPRIDVAGFGRAILWTLPAVAGVLLSRVPHPMARWAGGLVLAYCLLEAGYAFFGAAYRAVGLVPPPLHVLPLASTSVGELWSVRWARPISTWLRETCFRPLARRRRPRLGLFAGFVVSAIGHAYPVYVASDLTMAAMMLSFFLVQGAFVVLETRIGVAKWPSLARRAWTIAVMLGTSPLFVEPALRVIG